MSKKHIGISSELTLNISSCERPGTLHPCSIYYADTLITHLQANDSHSFNTHPFCSNKTSLNLTGTKSGVRNASMAARLPQEINVSLGTDSIISATFDKEECLWQPCSISLRN